MRSQRRRKRWLRVLVLLAALAAAVFLLLRCGGDFGLGLGNGWGIAGDGDGDDDSDDGAATSADKPAKAVKRCRLRLDLTGLTLDDVPVSIERAVAACKTAGEADLTVTGDARQGTLDATKSALEQAGVRVYAR
jgi:hypothetical protein